MRRCLSTWPGDADILALFEGMLPTHTHTYAHTHAHESNADFVVVFLLSRNQHSNSIHMHGSL